MSLTSSYSDLSTKDSPSFVRRCTPIDGVVDVSPVLFPSKRQKYQRPVRPDVSEPRNIRSRGARGCQPLHCRHRASLGDAGQHGSCRV